MAVPGGKAATVTNERKGDRVRDFQRESEDVAVFAFAAICCRMGMNFRASPFAAERWSSQEAGGGAGGVRDIFLIGGG